MQEIILDFVITATDCSSLEICEIYLPMFFMVTAQALGQSYHCPSACNHKDKKISVATTYTKVNQVQQSANNSYDILYFQFEIMVCLTITIFC